MSEVPAPSPAAPASAAVTAAVHPEPARRAERLPPWNVVLLDDDDHTYEYVIRLSQQLFNHSTERAFSIACTVDQHGRAVLFTGHRELAELKREQVHAFGKDPLIAHCSGAMSAVIEPAFSDDADDSSSPPPEPRG